MNKFSYKEFRSDGWPLCPNCGDEELWSNVMTMWSGEGERPTVDDCIKGEMTCYSCNWNSWREGLNQAEWPSEIAA